MVRDPSKYMIYINVFLMEHKTLQGD